MLGLMQDWPLLCHTILDHAAANHGEREIVSRLVEGNIHRETYKDAKDRSLRLAQGLARDGFRLGDRIGTLAWNTHRHLEAWYGIMGIGAIYHTINPRLSADHIAYIANHAEDSALFVDITFLPIVEALRDQLKSVRKFIVLTDDAHMPETKLANAVPYESWLAANDGDFEWARFDENTAAGLCYTSGTTGNPKGVLYSHRSNILQTLAVNTADGLGMRSADTILPVVPMFHANAWSIAFGAPAAGTKLVLPGPHMDGESIYTLLTTEKVSITAAVPTVWLMLLAHLEQNNLTLPYLDKVVIGGSACPRSMMETFETKYDVRVFHAWGMTEMSPVGTIGTLKGDMENLPLDKQIDIKLKQGRAMYCVEMKIQNDQGEELSWDGKSYGHLMVRGPAVARAYFKGEGGSILDDDGFFDTGDISSIDSQGYMQITDRSKDVIKSGGEWISSIELENAAVGHPDLAEAAVIGVDHPKWDERPLLICVPKPGAHPTKESVLDYLKGKVAKWWIPDDVVFVEEIPHTATGKIQKRDLRERFKDYKLPTG